MAKNVFNRKAFSTIAIASQPAKTAILVYDIYGSKPIIAPVFLLAIVPVFKM